MYPYNYNMPRNGRSMRQINQSFGPRRNDDRFFGGGFLVPFVLGGIAGSAINNRPYYYPYPYPTNYYYSNYYYPYPTYY